MLCKKVQSSLQHLWIILISVVLAVSGSDYTHDAETVVTPKTGTDTSVYPTLSQLDSKRHLQ